MGCSQEYRESVTKKKGKMGFRKATSSPCHNKNIFAFSPQSAVRKEKENPKRKNRKVKKVSAV